MASERLLLISQRKIQQAREGASKRALHEMIQMMPKVQRRSQQVEEAMDMEHLPRNIRVYMKPD